MSTIFIRIYSGIRSCQQFSYEYIQIFVGLKINMKVALCFGGFHCILCSIVALVCLLHELCMHCFELHWARFVALVCLLRGLFMHCFELQCSRFGRRELEKASRPSLGHRGGQKGPKKRLFSPFGCFGPRKGLRGAPHQNVKVS